MFVLKLSGTQKNNKFYNMKKYYKNTNITPSPII